VNTLPQWVPGLPKRPEGDPLLLLLPQHVRVVVAVAQVPTPNNLITI
jgi:hypothetical protein